MTKPRIEDAVARRPAGRPRSDGRPHLTRADVFLAAARLISEHGYAGASVRMIAQAVGASAASLFNLFGSKDELLNALIAYLAGPSLAFYADVEAEVAAGASAPSALFRMVLEEARLVASVERAFVAVFLLPELQQPQFGPARAVRDALVGFYERRIREGLATGSLVCDHPRLAAEQLFQLTETSMVMPAEHAAPSPDLLALATARFCLRGLLAAPEFLDSVEHEAAALQVELRLPSS